MTGQPGPEQVRRRRERDRLSHARARACERGEDPGEIPGALPALRRVVLPVSRAPQGWKARAACRTFPPEWFDAETDADAAKALRVCAGCPVRSECLLAAAADKVRSGVWGGIDLSAAEDREPRCAAARAARRDPRALRRAPAGQTRAPAVGAGPAPGTRRGGGRWVRTKARCPVRSR